MRSATRFQIFITRVLPILNNLLMRVERGARNSLRLSPNTPWPLLWRLLLQSFTKLMRTRQNYDAATISTLHFFLKNSFYKNTKAWIAEKIRTMLKTSEDLNLSKINVLVEFFKNLEKIPGILEKNLCISIVKIKYLWYTFFSL